MSQSRPVSEEEFAGWLQDPVTLRLKEFLKQRRVSLMMSWSRGEFTAQDQFGTAISNAESIGMCQAFGKIETIEFGDLQEIENEE